MFPRNFRMNGTRSAVRLARRPPSHRFYAVRRYLHESVFNSGSLLQSHNPLNARNRKRGRPFGSYSLHNVPAVRAISFSRVLPKLAVKLVRIPAMFGTAMIAGLAYLQYQATRKYSHIKMWAGADTGYS